MISINYNNILKKQVSLQHGLPEADLKSFCKKTQKTVSAVFSAKNKMGYHFLNLPDDIGLLRKIKAYTKKQKVNKWENIVVFGIGGSSLGPIAVQEAILGPLSQLGPKPHLFVVDNIDPDYVNQVLNSIKLEKSLFIIISKSGGTVEPMSLYNTVKDKLTKKFPKNYQKHFLFITDPKNGLLRKLGEKEKIEMFDIPPKVGGRFSVLSAVGLVPLALIGIDIGKLQKGARLMKGKIKRKKGIENPALLMSAIQYLMDRKKKKTMTVMMPYSNFLFRIGDWYRQLLAESIGKNLNTGPTPINALGSTDQHSQLQLYNEGPNNKLIYFLRINQFNSDIKLGNALPKEIAYLNGKKMSDIIDAAYLGTAESLSKNKRPNLTLNIKKLNEESVGELFMLFEFQVALLGFFYKIDAFNQPGVELSKSLTKELLSKTK